MWMKRRDGQPYAGLRGSDAIARNLNAPLP